MFAVLIYLPNTNNLNNFITKLRAFTEGGRRNTQANATRVKAVSGVCLTFGVQNLNPQQEKAVSEFLGGSDVGIRKLAYGIWKDLNISYAFTRWWPLNFQSSTAIFQA